MWNALMVKGAKFSESNIPFCPTTAEEIPRELISYTEARAIYNRRMKRGDKNFFVNAFVHFYQHELNPHTIIIYGSDNLPCIESVRQKINIVSFKSERALAFEEKKS